VIVMSRTNQQKVKDGRKNMKIVSLKWPITSVLTV
jgi:hypothetical protein